MQPMIACSRCFSFFYFSNRGFLVEGTTDGLVLLRATDIVASAGNSNLRKLQTSSMTSTVAIIKAGVNKIYQLIQKHAST